MTRTERKSARRPLRVALTGGIATGKSHCLAEFKRLGAEILDADQVARDVVAPGTDGFDAVVRRFGQSVLLPGNQLNRAMLGARIFADPAARKDLEAIVHPRVYAEMDRWFRALTHPIGVADIPLLYETDRAGGFDRVVVAACTPAQQVARLMARNRLTEAAARVRIATQLPLAHKVARADYVIDTTGTIEQTAQNAQAVWKQLQVEIENGSSGTRRAVSR